MLKKIKNLIIYYLARSIMGMIAFIPEFLVPFYGLLIGKFAFFTAVKLRGIAVSQLMESYKHMTRKRAIVITRGLFIHLAVSVIELCRLLRDKNLMPSVSISKSSMNSLNKAFQLNKGVIFITGHIGNWELMAAKLAHMGIPVFTVAKKSYDKRFTIYLMKKRESLQVYPIFRQSNGAPVKMVRALRKNGLLGFLIDQDTDVKSEFVTFFNRLASTPSGAAAFAIRTGTPVVAGTIRRKRDFSHEIIIENVTINEDEKLSTEILTKILEERIRMRPSQWVWFHERWKTKNK